MQPFCLRLFLYRHPSPCTVVTLRKIRRKSNFAQVSIEYRPTYGQLYIQKYQAVQLKSSFQHAETSSASARSARRLYYHPAVFFHHFLLIALSFTREKFKHEFKIRSICNFVYSFKIAQSETAYVRECLHSL